MSRRWPLRPGSRCDSFVGLMHCRLSFAPRYREALVRALVLLGLLVLVSVPLLGLHVDATKAESGGLADAPWPMFGHDPQHTGRSPYNGPELPQEKWSFTTESGVMSSPAIAADGTIYLVSGDSLYAINPDGSQKWMSRGRYAHSSPAIGADGTIYVGSLDCYLHAINPDGSEKWALRSSWVHSSPAIAADGTIYAGSYDKNLYAINPDGSQQWSFTTAGMIDSSPAIAADGTIYAVSGDSLYAINPDGSQKWVSRGLYAWSSPAIGADGTIYVRYAGENLYVINPDGLQKRVLPTGWGYSCPAIGADGTIYTGGHRLYAINPDGSQKWRYGKGDTFGSPVIAADGTIYAVSGNNLYAINPDGSQKWNYDEGDMFGSPVIGADGTIYVYSSGNRLRAVCEGPPQAAFTATPTSGVVPVTVQFTDRSAGKITSWSWDFDDDGTADSTEQNPSHTYSTACDHTVSLMITGPAGSDAEIKPDYIQVVALQTFLASIEGDARRLRQLAPFGDIATEFISRDQLRQRLIEELEEEVEEIDITQEVFVLLDLVSEEQDLYQIMLETSAEGVLGYYDDEVGIMYVIAEEEGLGPLEETSFAHEYTHALQDQHFDLTTLGEVEDNSDLSLARRCLGEGDAALLEGLYYLLVFDDAEREVYDRQASEAQAGDGDALGLLRENLIFPYAQGVQFVAALFDQDGWQAVNRAYSDPPQSTEQIIHPEKYLERDEPQAVAIPELASALGTGWEQLDSDVLGELTLKLHLESYLGTSQATRAAEGWDGDRCVFLKDAGGRKLLVLRSVWDSSFDALEFFDAYVRFVAEKSGGSWDLTLDDSNKRWWQTEGLSLYLERGGREVLVVMAPDQAVADKAIAGFYGFAAGLDCSCPGAARRVSGAELALGYLMTGLCWGTGYCLVRRTSRGR